MLHYWYTAWPDHKAPDVAKQMLELCKEVEIARFHPETGAPKGPVIVHCRLVLIQGNSQVYIPKQGLKRVLS